MFSTQQYSTRSQNNVFFYHFYQLTLPDLIDADVRSMSWLRWLRRRCRWVIFPTEILIHFRICRWILLWRRWSLDGEKIICHVVTQFRSVDHSFNSAVGK